MEVAPKFASLFLFGIFIVGYAIGQFWERFTSSTMDNEEYAYNAGFEAGYARGYKDNQRDERWTRN